MRNWLDGTPVLPVFVADITGHNSTGALKFQKVDRGIDFPEVMHRRGTHAQQILDNLGYAVPSHPVF